MAKELIIVFLYDTQIRLTEEDDPQKAVVYFYPSWVSGNQRMALCGQLIGVTQFLESNFVFPRILALKCGKFMVKKFGRYMMCVGTDRNIPDWILQKRSDALHRTVTFFHYSLSNAVHVKEPDDIAEDLNRIFEIYLPVLVYAGNIFVNTPTIRLPKSASSIFLEAAQILECLQDKNGVHGGAIFYQNKVVMSQLSTEITKQLVITDPYRTKLPAEYVQTSFHLPVGVQLLIVYINEDEVTQLKRDGLPSKSFMKSKFHKNQSAVTNYDAAVKRTQSRIFTVMEEEAEHHQDLTSSLKLANMPDVVKDTMKISAELRSDDLAHVNVSARIVDDCPLPANISHSADNLENSDISPIRYYSLGLSSMIAKLSSSHNSLTDSANCVLTVNSVKKISRKNRSPNLNLYYNTISDPVFPWFRYNGLPASKALLDDRISAYYKSIDNDTKQEVPDTVPEVKQNEEVKSEESLTKDEHPIRPTSISLSGERKNCKKAQIRKALNLDLKNNIPAENTVVIDDCRNNDPLTPLMTKLKSLEIEENKSTFTPTFAYAGGYNKAANANRNCDYANEDREMMEIKNSVKHDTTVSDDIIKPRQTSYGKFPSSRKKHKRKAQLKFQIASEPKRYVLYVFGQQNISIFLVMNEELSKDPDLIHFLWKTCFNCVSDLERHFRQCFEPIPQTQGFDSSSADSYSYVNIHRGWDTLQKGGSWTASQLDVLSTLHNDFNNASNITDITARTDDAVIYGSQLGDNQVFYQQPVSDVAGLPMPSDLMGVVQLKAKRRLERDHGILLI